MGYTRMTIWVEGPDDVRFFERIIKPIVHRSYDFVEVRPYATLKDSKLIGFIHSIDSVAQSPGIRYDYILQRDLDDAPCFTEARSRWAVRIPCCKPGRIVVPKGEIEAWYLGGVAPTQCNALGIQCIGNTDGITKESFNALIPKRFSSRIDFMNELLRSYDIDLATANNASFHYLIRDFLPRICA